MPLFDAGTYINAPNMKHRKKKPKYLRFSAGPLRGQYVHRVIAAAKIGRPLGPHETVDHEDGNTLNDEPSNLSFPISWEEHGRRTAARLRKQEEESEQRKREQAKCPF